jgi:hypothetical protein
LRRPNLKSRKPKRLLKKRSNDDAVLVVNGATELFNPTIDQAKIARELADDPEAARSDWMAEFRSGLSALLDDAVIDDAIDYARPLELPPRQGLKYHGFVDASAGRGDAFTCCIGHCQDNKENARFVCDVIRGRSAPFDDPQAVAQEYVQLANAYSCNAITGDNYSGEWVANAFRNGAQRYEVSPHLQPRRRLHPVARYPVTRVAWPRAQNASQRQGCRRSSQGAWYRRLCQCAVWRSYMPGGVSGISGIRWHDPDDKPRTLTVIALDESGREVNRSVLSPDPAYGRGSD